MPTITVRNVPPKVIQSLKALARRHNRSMEQEVRDLIEGYVAERRAVLDQIELQYGPDDRAIKLKGNANLTFGPRPEVNGTLSSPQIDLDRVLGLPEATRRRPLVAIRTLAESFISASRLPIPTTTTGQ